MTSRRPQRPTPRVAQRTANRAPATPQPATPGAAQIWLHATRVAIIVGGVAVFVGATGLARAGHPSHTRHASVPLEAPPAFVDAVRTASLDAGKIAAAEGPPQAATSES